MKRAIALAGRGIGRVNPNPMVGAVVVRHGKIVGQGYHLYQGRDHAEVIALERAGSQAKGATLYVSLEPCAHDGRTPPCVDRIVQAGIRKVFVAVRDPQRHGHRKGLSVLQRKGIEVELGLCGEVATRQNEKFLHSGTLSRTMNPTNYEQFQNYNILVSLFYSWNRLSIWTTFSTQIANPTLPALLNSTWRLASTFPGGFAEIHNIALFQSQILLIKKIHGG